jgi:hypothetical protein
MLGIGLLVSAHAADYLTFLVMVARHGIGAEANPIVVTLAEQHGLLLLTAAKASVVLLMAATFFVVGRSRPRLAAATLSVGVLLGSLGALSNVATI